MLTTIHILHYKTIMQKIASFSNREGIIHVQPFCGELKQLVA